VLKLSSNVNECKPLLLGEARQARHPGHGRAVQVDPINPTLTPPGTERLKLICDDPLTNLAFEFNLRRYTVANSGPHTNASQFYVTAAPLAFLDGKKVAFGRVIDGRGLHSSTFQLNLSRFGHTSPCPPV